MAFALIESSNIDDRRRAFENTCGRKHQILCHSFAAMFIDTYVIGLVVRLVLLEVEYRKHRRIASSSSQIKKPSTPVKSPDVADVACVAVSIGKYRKLKYIILTIESTLGETR